VDEDEIMVDADAAIDEDEDAEGEEVDTGSEEPTPLMPAEPATAARGTRSQKPNVTLTPASSVQLSAVESKEAALGIHTVDDDDDDELSDIDDEEEDAEGEDDDEDVVKVAADDDDDELDSDGGTPASGSRALTPDLSKLTRRQRAAFEDYDVGLLALSNEAQKKKVFTAEETAMRRAEMARRRKNLSEKRNEEEKMDTINRLLKKQAPKRRGRGLAEVTEAGEEDPEQKASPLFARWVNNAQGSRVAVPEEWLGKAVGRVFDAPVAPRSYPHVMQRMVEEVD
jgi:Ino eighty subunit 2